MSEKPLHRSLVMWVAVIATGWTALVAASLGWNYVNDHHILEEVAEAANRSNDPRDAKYRDPSVLGTPLMRMEYAVHGGTWSVGLLALGVAARLVESAACADADRGHTPSERGAIPFARGTSRRWIRTPRRLKAGSSTSTTRPAGSWATRRRRRSASPSRISIRQSPQKPLPHDSVRESARRLSRSRPCTVARTARSSRSR